MSYLIMQRKRILVNTDPQRRCYNGVYFSCEEAWTAWSELEPEATQEAAEKRIEFWQSLTAYAVSQRGKSAECEYKIEEVVEHNALKLAREYVESAPTPAERQRRKRQMFSTLYHNPSTDFKGKP